MNKQQCAEYLTRAEQLVKAHTAFRSLAELCIATMKGYVPSIYGIRKNKETREKAELTTLLRGMGIKVYDGQVK